AHAPAARKAGISAATVTAVRDRRDLTSLPAGERDVVDYARQLLRSNRVAQPLFDRLQSQHGVLWLVELTCLIGHYGILAGILTVTELAEQTRRIMRVSDLPRMVDADHGYGNALNVMRTVEELETSGVAALTIEDTVLPMPFGRRGDGLVSVEEMLGKLRGAVAARQDPALVVIGRTGALG